jgi:hypothetical protein
MFEHCLFWITREGNCFVIQVRSAWKQKNVRFLPGKVLVLRTIRSASRESSFLEKKNDFISIAAFSFINSASVRNKTYALIMWVLPSSSVSNSSNNKFFGKSLHCRPGGMDTYFAPASG